MPFEIFTAHHNVTLSQVASLSRMNLRSPYTDAILADSDVPSYGTTLNFLLMYLARARRNPNPTGSWVGPNSTQVPDYAYNAHSVSVLRSVAVSRGQSSCSHCHTAARAQVQPNQTRTRSMTQSQNLQHEIEPRHSFNVIKSYLKER